MDGESNESVYNNFGMSSKSKTMEYGIIERESTAATQKNVIN